MKILKAIPVEHYKLKVTFSSGETLLCDLTGKLSGELFEPFKDVIFFNHVAIDDSGACFWPNKADLCPDFLYELGKRNSVA